MADIVVLHPRCGRCGSRHEVDAYCTARDRVAGTSPANLPVPPAPRLDELDDEELDLCLPSAELNPGWGRRERGARRW